MRSKSNRFFPTAGGLTSRREVLRHGAAIAAVSIIAPSFPRFARAQTVTTFDYYISTNGSDANNGLTPATAWAITSLSRWTNNGHNQANYGKLAGKRIGLVAGTYNVGNLVALVDNGNGQGYNPALSVPMGSSSSPTYIGSCDTSGSYSRGSAIIDGQSNSNNCSIIGQADDVYPNEGYATIDGLVFKNPAVGGHTVIFGGSSDWSPSRNDAIHGVTVTNCEFTSQNFTNLKMGNNGNCIDLTGCSAALISNNYFHDFTGPTWGGSGSPTSTSLHLIAVQLWRSQGCILEYNTVIGPTGFMGKENVCFGNTIRYNYIDCTGWSDAYCLWDFSNEPGDAAPAAGLSNDIYNNVFVGVSDLLSSDTYTWYNPGPVSFVNNTVYCVGSSQLGVQCCFRAKCPAGDLTVYNNIMVQAAATGGQNAFLITNIGAPGILDYNLYYAKTSSNFGYYSSATVSPPSYVSSLTGWLSEMGGAFEAHSRNGDPLFVNAGGTGPNNYKVNAGSPSSGTGSSTGKSGGSACDMGAWGGPNPPAQIGCSFGPGATGGGVTADPTAPVLTVS